jgi:single-stranded DNA-specific DHH superfamily exonuclease
MVLTEKQYEQIREELDVCNKPLIFFHDDPDGLASFLLLYRYKKEGRGVPVKTTPIVDSKFLPKVEEYMPDKIFVVDLAIVEQDFIDNAKVDGKRVPIVWIDHHQPLQRDNITYFNPRKGDEPANHCNAYLCYNVIKNHRPEDLWIAAMGCIGDWFFPDIMEEVKEKYPDMLPKEITKPEDALFNSQLGKLVHILSFVLKGKIGEVMKCVKILTRIEHPDEILKQTTPRGKYIFKRAADMVNDYEKLLSTATEVVGDDRLIVFKYAHTTFSFTKELANEVLYKFPDKYLIIGRQSGDEVKCSLRGADLHLPCILEQALQGVEGYGGGHEHACGCAIKINDFDKFVVNYRQAIQDYKDGKLKP